MRTLCFGLFVLTAIGWTAAFAGEDAPAKDAAPAKGDPVFENRLAKERSPYLRQHKNNPVDWYPWGAEAFALAKKLDRPVFLSVGYAACHWCHVMEHESFEDKATAKILNTHYVCVKVDREERPDVDRVYMNAVHAQRQGGGWPMTVIMLPDGRPFFTATYLKPAQIADITRQVQAAWVNKRADIVNAAARLSGAAQELGRGKELPPVAGSDQDLIETMRTALAAAFDTVHGGYGTNRKFPPHTELLYFLEDGAVRARPDDLRQMRVTLDAVERGGLHDHVGGGFHRYCTDREWLLPHFEKMLYDNALLARAYVAASLQFKDPRYRRAAERTFAWLDREMAQPGGGYASSLDADTEGEEGLTYTWTMDELKAALSAEQLDTLAALSALTPAGNFHDEATGKLTGRNIVYLAQPIDKLAQSRTLDAATVFASYESAMATLQAARKSKPQPGLDDKVIVGWNGLLVSALARAGQAFKDPVYLDKAKALATFLLKQCRREDGALLRFPKGSGPEILGFCEDHVHVIEGLLDLHAITGDAAWLASARDLGTRLINEFQDVQAGGFWTTSSAKHETLFARAKETWDSPIPSDNGTATRLCLRLAALTDDPAFRKAADNALAAFRPTMGYARMSNGLVALFRALTDRLAMDSAMATSEADAHLRQDVFAVDVFQQFAEAAPGSKIRVSIQIKLDAGWHIDTKQAALVAALTMAEGALGTLEQVSATKSSGGEVLSFDATVVIPASATPGAHTMSLRLRLAPCNDAGVCKVPAELALDLSLRVGAQGDARHPTRFK